MKNKLKIASISVIALGLFACGPMKATTNTKPLQETEKIVLLDFPLKNLNIVKHSSAKTDSGQFVVQLDMENEKNKDIWTDIQVVFRDANGMEVERTSWEPFQFHRRAVSSYKKVSMRSDISDYRILIRNEK